MNLLPPLPAWDGMHPLVVHFPIALLLIAPLLVVAGLGWRSGGRGLMAGAFALMLLGTLGAWVAVGSGQAAGERAEEMGGPAAEQVVDQHESLALTTRNVFTGLTLVFAAMFFGPIITRRSLDRMPSAALHAAFLAIYGGGLVYLINTAHQGGRLVHEMGVLAVVTPGQSGGGMVLGSGTAGEAGEAGERAETGDAAERAGRAQGGTARGPAPSAAAGATAAPATGGAEAREPGTRGEPGERQANDRDQR